MERTVLSSISDIALSVNRMNWNIFKWSIGCFKLFNCNKNWENNFDIHLASSRQHILHQKNAQLRQVLWQNTLKSAESVICRVSVIDLPFCFRYCFKLTISCILQAKHTCICIVRKTRLKYKAFYSWTYFYVDMYLPLLLTNELNKYFKFMLHQM